MNVSKINKRSLILIVCTIISMISLPLGFPWLACVVYIGVIIYFAYLNNETTLICFCTLIVFQNIVLIIFAGYLNNTYMVIMLAIKELLIYFAVLRGIYQLFIAKKLKHIILSHKFTVAMLCVLAICVFINSVNTSADLLSVIVSVRQLCIPIACFLMGYVLNISKDGIERIKRVIVYIAIFLTVFGIFEMLLPENIIWQKLDYDAFLEVKQNYMPIIYKGVTSNFYTWDLGFLMRRMISITADPLATAHLVFFGLIVLLLLKDNAKSNEKEKKMQAIGVIVLLLGCILGFSKGTILYLLILAVGLAYQRFGKNISSKTIILLVSAMLLIFVGMISVLYFTASQPTAITNHVDGFINGIKDSTLFGNGMGTVGATNQAITGATVSNSESYFGVCLNQIGYIGMIAMGLLWCRLLVQNIKRYCETREKKSLFFVILTVGLTLDMILSESSVSIIGTGIYFIFLGVFAKEYEDNAEEA